MIVVRMKHSGELRTVDATRAKQLIESNQAVPVQQNQVRTAVLKDKRETR